MEDISALRDPDAARQHGSSFGREVGRLTGSAMMQVGLSDQAIKAIGAEGVTLILERAEGLAGAGLNRTIVAAWTEAAAETFTAELDRAAALVRSDGASGSKH